MDSSDEELLFVCAALHDEEEKKTEVGSGNEWRKGKGRRVSYSGPSFERRPEELRQVFSDVLREVSRTVEINCRRHKKRYTNYRDAISAEERLALTLR